MTYSKNKTYKNVTVVPTKVLIDCNSIGAYTAEKEYIPFSTSVLWHRAAYCPAKLKLEGEYIFGGVLYYHIGHLILETLPRLWYAKNNPQLPIVFASPKIDPLSALQYEIFDLLEIKNEIIFLDTSTEVEILHFPFPLSSFFTYTTKEFYDFLACYESPGVIPGKKIYVSRGAYAARGFENNDAIENYAKEEGYTVIDPELMTLKDRLYEISTAEKIMMIQGSAMLSFLFVKELQAEILLLMRSDYPEPSMDVPANVMSINWLDLSSKIISVGILPFDQTLYVDISNLHEVIQEKKYKTFKYTPYISDEVFAMEKLRSNYYLDFLEALNTASFESEKKLYFLQEAVKLFSANEKCKKNYPLVFNEDGYDYHSPFELFIKEYYIASLSLEDQNIAYDLFINILQIYTANSFSNRTLLAEHYLLLVLEQYLQSTQDIKKKINLLRPLVGVIIAEKKAKKYTLELLELYCKNNCDIILISYFKDMLYKTFKMDNDPQYMDDMLTILSRYKKIILIAQRLLNNGIVEDLFYEKVMQLFKDTYNKTENTYLLKETLIKSPKKYLQLFTLSVIK